MIKEINPDGTSTLLNDTLSNVKFSNTAWAPNNKVTHCPEILKECHLVLVYDCIKNEEFPLPCYALY